MTSTNGSTPVPRHVALITSTDRKEHPDTMAIGAALLQQGALVTIASLDELEEGATAIWLPSRRRPLTSGPVLLRFAAGDWPAVPALAAALARHGHEVVNGDAAWTSPDESAVRLEACGIRVATPPSRTAGSVVLVVGGTAKSGFPPDNRSTPATPEPAVASLAESAAEALDVGVLSQIAVARTPDGLAVAGADASDSLALLSELGPAIYGHVARAVLTHDQRGPGRRGRHGVGD